MKFKRIRVPVQRLIILLPIEEQDEPNYLSKVKAVEEKTVDEHAAREQGSIVDVIDVVEEDMKNVVTSVEQTSDQTRIEDDKENLVVNEVECDVEFCAVKPA